MNRSKVYLTSFAKTVAADLARSQPERRVEFVIADDVTAEGDPVMLRIAIQNLKRRYVLFYDILLLMGAMSMFCFASWRAACSFHIACRDKEDLSGA